MTTDVTTSEDIAAQATALPATAAGSSPPAAKPEKPKTTPTPEAPEKVLKPKRAGRTRSWGVTSLAAISFSLTFVLTSIALLMGVLPDRVASLPMPVDLGVLLLIVPLCALVAAIMAEALRAALQGVPASAPRPLMTLADWKPGPREG